MRYFWLTLNWLGAVIFLALAVAVATSSLRGAIPLLLLAGMFAPPFQSFCARRLNVSLSPKSKAICTVILVVSSVIGIGIQASRDEEKRKAAMAEEERVRAEAARARRIAELQANREGLFEMARQALQEDRPADVLSSTAKYDGLGDSELTQLRSEASSRIAAKKAALDLERRKQRDAARMQEINSELLKTPAQDNKRNFELYAELSKLAPQDSKVAQKLEVYRKRYEAQKEKERLAAETEAKIAHEKAERKKKIESQFSAWDGSHRNLVAYIKKSMNDPDSYKHEETRFKDQGKFLLVSTTFRGKNAFGGVVKNTVWAKVDFEGNVIEILKSGP